MKWETVRMKTKVIAGTFIAAYAVFMIKIITWVI